MVVLLQPSAVKMVRLLAKVLLLHERHVFQAAWPGVLLTLGMADKETIGDLVESLLGYYYNLRLVWDRTLQGPAADTCEDFIRALELACFARWAAGYAAPNTVG